VPDDRDQCPRTPFGVKVADDGCVYGKVSMFMKLEFDSGKAIVKKAYHQELQKAAAFMKEHPEATATIVGHTDNLEKRRMELSQARAENVRRYLVKQFGIDASRIKALSFGAEKPIANNKTKEGRKKNRRAVALFEAVEKK
jgi:OOP family OmpA-OmpF porin